MTLRDFCALSHEGKTEQVELWGDLVTERIQPAYSVRVYQLYDFYVEVYHSTKTNRIERHRACIGREAVAG